MAGRSCMLSFIRQEHHNKCAMSKSQFRFPGPANLTATDLMNIAVANSSQALKNMRIITEL